MTPARALLASVLVASALVLAGCGDHRQAARSTGPRGEFPRALARQLAAESDDVARKLAAGAPCAALAVAMQLRARTLRAIDSGRVPAAFRRTLRSTTADLASRIRCVPQTVSSPRARPAPPAEEHGHVNHGKHKGHGKHSRGKGEGD